MKVYLATSGEYSDYCVQAVFTNEADAQAYELGEQVEEYELHEGPVEIRDWHVLTWYSDREERPGTPSWLIANPYESSYRRPFDGHSRHTEHRWQRTQGSSQGRLVVEGWKLERVRKVYSEQRAQYLARAALEGDTEGGG